MLAEVMPMFLRLLASLVLIAACAAAEDQQLLNKLLNEIPATAQQPSDKAIEKELSSLLNQRALPAAQPAKKQGSLDPKNMAQIRVLISASTPCAIPLKEIKPPRDKHFSMHEIPVPNRPIDSMPIEHGRVCGEPHLPVNK